MSNADRYLKLFLEGYEDPKALAESFRLLDAVILRVRPLGRRWAVAEGVFPDGSVV